MAAARRATWLCGLAAILGTAAAEPEISRFEFRQAHMGSEFKLVLYTNDPATARRASRLAFDRIAQLDKILSDYDPESELIRLCDRAGGPPVPVSADLFRILERSLMMAERSEGAFDPTIGPVVRLWRRARRDHRLPEPATLEKARARVGFDKVKLDPKARSVRLLKPGMRLDLGGIAKGFAASEALKVLKDAGIDRALVAGAGDINVGDPPPGAVGWTIGIASLDNPNAKPSQFLKLKNVAVSTSGDAERFVVIDGRRYSHIVDPRTGLGVIARSSVTVVAPDGATADSLATAVYVLGPERGLKLVEQTREAACLIVRAREGAPEMLESSRWKGLPRGRTEAPSRSNQPTSD